MHKNLLLDTSDSQTIEKLRLNTTLRELLTIAFRHRCLALISFSGVFLGGLLVILLLPNHYQATLKVLVRNERSNPIVSPGPDANQTIAQITDEDLNSEVELLKSEDVLRKVVINLGLTPKQSVLPWAHRSEDERISRALLKLRDHIDAGQLPRSNIIEVKFESTNPQFAANVLNNLGNFYLEKHLQVHRTTGEYDFFNQQAEQYRKQLETAENNLNHSGSVSPQQALELTIQKQKNFEESFEQTQNTIAETQRRLTVLHQENASTPRRMTTQSHTLDNSQLLQSLKSTLLNLQLRRIELLNKFQPTYRPVQELDKQIASTQAAIHAAEQSPLRDQTTDQDPVHLWQRSEIARANADLIALQSRATSMQHTLDEYNLEAQALQNQSLHQQDLLRSVKTAEDNYLLYSHKREEARISDALDERRILNVAIAEYAHAPAMPVTPIQLRLALCVGLALICCVGLIALAEYFDPTFRTPAEVTTYLSLPVFACIPCQGSYLPNTTSSVRRDMFKTNKPSHRLPPIAPSDETDYGSSLT
jgi:uncharacterized protein involved in exopolysaccharide biosynthesis